MGRPNAARRDTAGTEPAASRHRTPLEDTPRIRDELASLEDADRATLARRWRETFEAPVPARISDDFIRRALAYELQLRSADPDLRAMQQRIGKLAAIDPLPRTKVAGRLKPGTRLVREWNGGLYLVTVTERAFLYRDRSFANLSVIAREITGTRWSGPAFFGLKPRRRANDA
jgi:hypothetical protein